MAQSALFLGTSPLNRIGISAAAGRPTPVTVPWTRPAEWMTLPAAPTQGVSALYGVENGDGNYVAISCTTASGAYTVDWGDGTSSAGVASGVQAEHLYNYAGITNTATSSTTVTVDGMVQCIVKITPDTGNLISVNFNIKHSKSGLVSALGVNWLDINVQGAYLAGSVPISFGTSSQVVYHNYLERINIGTTGVFTNMQYMFQGCRALRNIVAFPDVTQVTNMTYMFNSCYSLQTIPAFPGSVAAVTNMTNMFNGCSTLQTIPAFPGSVAAVTSMANMFLSCSSLQTIPAFPGSVAAVTSMTNMFYSCSSLQTIPAFPGSVAAVTNMTSMFNSCFSLQTIPAFPGSVAAVTNMANMFSYCFSLQTIPAFPGSVAAVTNMTSMFNSCSSLQTIPAFPGSVAAVTNMTNMFYSCFSLQTIPAMVIGYSTAKDRAPSLTTPNWTLGTGWQYLTSPNKLDKNLDGATATTALNPATSVTGVSSTGVFTATSHGFQIGDRVQFTAITGGAGLTLQAIYIVASTSFASNTFTLNDLTGASTTFSSNLTAGTISRYNLGIVAGTTYRVTIVVDAISGSTATYTLGGVAGTALTAQTTYVDYITASTTAKLIITPVATGLRITISSIIIEEVAVATTIATSDASLYSVGITGMRRSIDFGGCKLSRSGILNIFNNLGTADGVPGAQTINTASNYGSADLIAAKGTLTTSTSPTINTLTAHGLLAGDFIRFSALTGPTGITTSTTYQIASAGLMTTAFQLVDAATGLIPITYTGTITAGTVNRYDYQIAINKGWTAT